MQVDEQLIRRLEATAAAATARLVETLCALDPLDRARQHPMAQGALIAMGVGRYVNRAMGVTLDALSDDDLDELESFFGAADLAPAVELSAWAASATVDALADRGFRPAWFRAMFAIDPSASVPGAADVEVVPVDDALVDTWLEVYATGFGAAVGPARDVSDEFATASRATPGTHVVLATIGGQAAGCATVQIAEEVAWVGGATTLPAFRRRGVQATLLAHRLQLARDLGCQVVAATAVPNGASARNMATLGFHHVQTQLVVHRPTPSR